jgi:hypothetical protein
MTPKRRGGMTGMPSTKTTRQTGKEFAGLHLIGMATKVFERAQVMVAAVAVVVAVAVVAVAVVAVVVVVIIGVVVVSVAIKTAHVKSEVK